MGREKLYIKGIEISKADELRQAQSDILTVNQDLSDYKVEVNQSLEDIKDEVRQIVMEGGEAEPIIINATGITVSVANNEAALLDALNTLLTKQEYNDAWLTNSTDDTHLDLYPGNTQIIFKLGEQSHNVNKITIYDRGEGDYALDITFFLDGSWAANGQTSTEPYMESYYEHVEDIYYAGFGISKEDYRNKEILEIFSDGMLVEKGYINMGGTRYYSPVTTYQTLTTNNDIAYEPVNEYNPATKKYVDDKALISAFTYFMESDTAFAGINIPEGGQQVLTFEEDEKNQLTEFINRYRQQKSFLHVTLQDGTKFLCDSLSDINLDTKTNVFAVTLQSYGDEVIADVYIEGIRDASTGEYTVNIARITLTRNPKASQITELENHINATIGNLDDLDTTDKSNVVAAVNETLGTFTADYYTKDEVRPAPYLINTGLSNSSTTTSLDISDITQFSTAITDAYKKGLKSIDVSLQFNTANNAQSIYTCSLIGNIQIKQTYFEGYYYHSNLHSLRRVYISGAWSGTTFTADAARITLAFDMWHFVSTQTNGFISSYTIPTQTNFDKAPKLTNHDTITADNHLVDKKYVTDAINNIPGQDLSGYYTSEEIDARLEDKQNTLIAGDNITITNNIISASGSSNAATLDSTIPVLDFSEGYSVKDNSGVRTINSTGLELLSSLFTTHYQQHGNFDNLIFLIKADGVLELFYSANTANSASLLYFTRRGFVTTSSNGANSSRLLQEYLTQEYFNISITDAIVTCTNINGNSNFSNYISGYLSSTLNSNYLNKTNTSSYTPTSNYHPATKLYVDNKVSNLASTKQDTLIAGTNITIENNIISAVNAGGAGGLGDSNLQVAELPEPSEENEGSIVEYTGNDNGMLKNGYFYRSAVDHVYHMDSLTTTQGYTDTKLLLKSNYKIEMKVKLNSYISNAHFFSGGGNSSYYCVRTYSNNYSYGNNGSVYNTSIPYQLNTELLITFNDDAGNVTINDSLLGTGIAVPNSGYNLYIFNSNSRMTLYYCKVWDKNSGELIANFIPVSVNGNTALYDTVSNYVCPWINRSYITAGTVEENLTQYRYWTPQYVQSMKPTYNWSNCLRTPKFYEDLQTIIDIYRNNSTYPDFSLGGYRLSSITLASSSSGTPGYRRYDLYFSRNYQTYSYNRSVTMYVTYSDYKLYGQESAYPVSINSNDTSYTFLTSHQSLSNYLPKNNSTAWTPTGDYNPATKKYVDDLVNTKDLTKYLSKTNSTEYIPTKAYHPATKQYVDNYATTLFNTVATLRFKEAEELPTEDISANTVYLIGTESPYNMYVYMEDTATWKLVGTTDIDFDPKVEYFEGSPEIIGNAYTVESRGSYGFSLNSTGFYESQNKGAHNTAAVCRINFQTEVPFELPITYINSGENSCDYGIFSKLDCELSTTNSDDGSTGSTKVFKNCRGENSTSPKTITYSIPTGEHFIDVKYRKDGSANSGNDSLQFKLDANFIIGAEYVIDVLKPNYVYKLNTLGFLTINDAPIFNRETVMFIRSEVGGLYVTLPAQWTHLGDCPDFTMNEDGYSQGLCAGNKNYIISFMNGIAIWKVYDVNDTTIDETDKEE